MSIKLLDPNDNYDINAINGNFAALSAAMRKEDDWQCPPDWPPMPNLEDSEKTCAVVRCLVAPGRINNLVVQVAFSENGHGSFTVDFGDGTFEEFQVPSTALNSYATHNYDFDSIDAPVDFDGYKHVFAIIRETGDYLATNIIVQRANSQSLGGFGNCNSTAELSVWARGTTTLRATVTNNMFVRRVNLFDVNSIYAGSTGSLAEINAEGENFVYISATTARSLRRLNVPKDNAYTYINMTYTKLEEIDINVTEATSFTVNNSEYARKIKPRGFYKSVINVSFSSLDRAGLIELMESLGTTESTKSLNISGCLGYYDLTDEDKQIAIAKGWTIA